MHFHRLTLLLAGLNALLPLDAAAECTAASGPGTTALVELYTSEGCSSCPPADRFLSRLPANANVVPLALHVDYWDYLGWRDPHANPGFAQRQRWLAGAGRRQAVYTPQVFVSGTEASWRGSDFDAEVRRINARPAQASLRIALEPAAPGHLAISVNATNRIATDTAQLFVALAENSLVSDVRAGENRGERLMHDHVVRLWMAPRSFVHGGAVLREDIALAPDWKPANMNLIAFVQDMVTGEVLQAVSRKLCGHE